MEEIVCLLNICIKKSYDIYVIKASMTVALVCHITVTLSGSACKQIHESNFKVYGSYKQSYQYLKSN